MCFLTGKHYMRFEVPVAVLLKFQVLWDVVAWDK